MAYCGGVNCFFQSSSVLTTFSTVTFPFLAPESSNSTNVTDTGLLPFAASTLLPRLHPHATVPAQPSAADRIARLETPRSDSITIFSNRLQLEYTRGVVVVHLAQGRVRQ